MYNRFSKETIVKTLFGLAIAVILGLSWWAGRYYSTLGAASDMDVAYGVTQRAMSVVIGEMDRDEVGAQFIDLQPAHALPGKVKDREERQDRLLEQNQPLASLPNLVYAAKVAIPAVVCIKATQETKVVTRPPNSLDQLFKEFFGDRFSLPREYERPGDVHIGSGVIYTSNGYIVTNNHVVDQTDHIEVTLHDNRCYKAKLVGSDPITDLALLKIEEEHLPFLKVGDSDKLEIGEWVLALGNPFGLNATVTKGIISAKYRGDMKFPGENRSLNRLQSFIQTDAALNTGNSGGALVNIYGELIGINTAITPSATGTFIGYGFAIPVSVVKKVIGDFIQYGAVQRVLLGLRFGNIDERLAGKLKVTKVDLLKRLGVSSGVYIDAVEDKSPFKGRLQSGDVITHINERRIHTGEQFHEIIASAEPGLRLAVTIYRNGKEKKIEIILEKEMGNVQIVPKGNAVQIEGAVFQDLDQNTKKKYNISAGVWVKEVAPGKFLHAGLKKGYILLSFDRKPVRSIIELTEMMRGMVENAVILQVIDPNRGSQPHNLMLDLSKS